MEDQKKQQTQQIFGRSKIMIPVLIGAAVLIYFILNKIDWEEVALIQWNTKMIFWVSLAFLFLVIRHFSYAYRLRVLSQGVFTWLKCIQLIFIWEFSSAVSPTAVGGSAAALFVLSREKISAARVTAIVLYTAILDTIFFVGTLPILLFCFGPSIIRPGLTDMMHLDGWGKSFLVAYFFMALYGVFFFYGLFIKPSGFKKLAIGVTSWSWLKRWREKAEKLGDDFILASKEMANHGFYFGCKAFLGTAGAWSSRFILLNCLIIAFQQDISLDFLTQTALYARLETMFVVMAFSPTPGSAGVAEILFHSFVSDYVPNETSTSIIAILWRLMTYYLYILVGALVIPAWIRGLVKKAK
jgi:uncharacterized protein (TIRG00374 family)